MPGFELASILLLAALGGFWLDSFRSRAAAIDAARAACGSEQLQLLDDTVALAGLGLGRDDGGRLRLRRTYSFEYSDTGDNRRRASVLLLGQRVLVVNIGLRRVPSDRILH